jgi:hypothetical protein
VAILEQGPWSTVASGAGDGVLSTTKGLGDKGFEHTERCFPYFNHIWWERQLRARQVKQYIQYDVL